MNVLKQITLSREDAKEFAKAHSGSEFLDLMVLYAACKVNETLKKIEARANDGNSKSNTQRVFNLSEFLPRKG
jgi:hypothetical protein